MKRVYTLFAGLLIMLGGGCATELHHPAESSQAVLRLGGNVDLIRLDKEPRFPTSLGFSRDPRVELDPGPHVLVLRYSAIQDIDGDDHVKFTSNPVTVEIKARGGDVFQVRHDGPDDISRPEEIDRNVPIEVVQVQSGTGPAGVLDDPAKPGVPEDAESSVPSVANAEVLRPLEQLKEYWKLASPEEQAEFMKWIIRK